MRFKFILLFCLLLSFVNAQKIDRKHFYGNWEIKGVVIQNKVVAFSSVDTLIRKLMENRRKEQPNSIISKPDSLGISIGAGILCELLNELVLEVAKTGEIVFKFTIRVSGKKDYKSETLQFVFVDDKTVATTDEKGKKNNLKVWELNAEELVFSGISSAREMKLCFTKTK